MKRKLALSAGLIMVFCLLMGGATLALFRDSATNSSKVITTGNVDIDSYRDGFDTIPGPMFYTTAAEGETTTDPAYPGLKPTGLWAPGDTHIRSMIVYNKGSLNAVVKQLKAIPVQDEKNMAKHMVVSVYKILPKYLPDGSPFFPIEGDDTFDQDALNEMSNEFNPIIMTAWALEEKPEGGDAYGLEQLLIEQGTALSANRLWTGSLEQLVNTTQDLDTGVYLKATKLAYQKRGTLLAFVVTLDKSTPNDYQGAQVKYNFEVGATSN